MNAIYFIFQDLTDKGADYSASYSKYFFESHIVLEFLVKNNVQDSVRIFKVLA